MVNMALTYLHCNYLPKCVDVELKLHELKRVLKYDIDVSAFTVRPNVIVEKPLHNSV